MVMCAACGAENPPGSRFCNSCGAALAAEALPAREERKVVTVLFCDLVGFTSHAEQLDPEDVRALLAAYHATLRRELERYGGTVEKFVGDAVMALFGAPVAHEDDPERAVRAALSIRDEVAELARAQHRELHVRVGITTGEALVDLAARPQAGEGMASGDVVNTAARLQTAAPVDGVLVDSATHRATDRVIAYRAAEPVTAKGKSDPVEAWEVVEARARLGTDVARTATTPLVGRDHEVDVLRGALARVRRERSPQLVTLVGVPGIGKSRLVHELFSAVEEDPELIYWRQGRSLPYGSDAGYWALAEMVKAHAGVLETDDDDTAAQKLGEMVATVLAGADDSPWVERHLRPLAGLGAVETAGDAGRDEAFAAWRRFLEAIAESGPTVLVFEDLHWADDGLLDFVDHLADWTTGIPLLVVCTARPELLTRHPGWGGGKPNAATISLAPLTDDETAQLVGALLNRSVMPAELQATLLARAGGNPLYAEEFVRMADERGLDRLELPETVQGIIAARLDDLPAAEKSLLQDAAVVGKVFWLGAVAAIGGRERWDAERRLHELERRQFVRRERRASVGGEVEYAFWHALVRDVAYGQIPRAARAERHRAAAEWIASLAADRLEDRAELLAHHYLSALELTRAAGGDTGPLEMPARVALRAAGERALALNSYAAATRFFDAALELWPEGDPERAHVLLGLGRAQYAGEDAGGGPLSEARDAFVASGDVENAAVADTLLGQLAWMRGRPAEAIERVQRAAGLLHGRTPSYAQAFVRASESRYLMLGGHGDEAVRVALEALALAEALGYEELQAAALNNLGTARGSLGDRDGLRDLERSIEISERIASPEVIRAYLNLASTAGGFGDMRRCAALHERALELAQRFGEKRGARFLQADMSVDRMMLGDWDGALELADALIAEVEAGTPHYMESGCRLVRAQIALGRDDVDFALAEYELGLAQARELGEPQALFPALANGPWLLLEAGREDAARALVEELVSTPAYAKEAAWWAIPAVIPMERLGLAGRIEPLLEPLHSDVPWVDAALDYAAGRFSEAAARLHEIGDVVTAAAAWTRAAQALAEAGRGAEAAEELARAVAIFRSVGATRYLRLAGAVLAA